MARLGKEDAVIRARLLVHNAINQANAEWQAGAWIKDWIRIQARQKQVAEAGHDPLKAIDQGRFGLLYDMPLNLSMWIDEQKPDGMSDAMANQEYRQWLQRQPETGYLKNYPLFGLDWDKLRPKGQK